MEAMGAMDLEEKALGLEEMRVVEVAEQAIFELSRADQKHLGLTLFSLCVHEWVGSLRWINGVSKSDRISSRFFVGEGVWWSF